MPKGGTTKTLAVIFLCYINRVGNPTGTYLPTGMVEQKNRILVYNQKASVVSRYQEGDIKSSPDGIEH